MGKTCSKFKIKKYKNIYLQKKIWFCFVRGLFYKIKLGLMLKLTLNPNRFNSKNFKISFEIGSISSFSILHPTTKLVLSLTR